MTEQVDILLVLGILISMLLSAFFSGMEIAFVPGNRMLFEMDKEKNGLSTRITDLFYKHPNDFVSAMLVGNNIVLVVYGIMIAKLFNSTIFNGMDAAFTVPADIAGTSESTLSVAISTIGWSISTLSPTFTNQRVIRASVIPSPIGGSMILISLAIKHLFFCVL